MASNRGEDSDDCKDNMENEESGVSRTDAAHPRFLPKYTKIGEEAAAPSIPADNKNRLRIAFLQMLVGRHKINNIKKAQNLIREAKSKGAQLAVLPECFNSPYGTEFFDKYAETIPDGATAKALADVAKETGIVVVGGSIPERDGQKLYNTCAVWNGAGEPVAKHRKVHLFDIDVPGKVYFKESDVLAGGDSFTTFLAGEHKVGLGICYDLRFEEMARLYAKEGCRLLLYPGAFNMTTGPLHWELLTRARACDTQMFVGSCSPARDAKAGYVAWGHSTLVDPWGTVVAKAGHEEEVLIADIDFSVIEEVRNQIPKTRHRRTDLYDTALKSNL